MNRVAWVAVVAASLLAAGCTTPAATGEPAPPQPVALKADGVPEGLRIGVVVSVSSPAGQGADWYSAAHGAAVAAYRYGQGGSQIRLDVADDKGSDSAAAQAVRDLVGRGATSIVLATSGEHTEAAAQAAADFGVVALAPYQSLSVPSSTVWLTGPSPAGTSEALSRALENVGASRPLLVLAGARSAPDGFGSWPSVSVIGDTDTIARQVEEEVEAESLDSVLVAGSAAEMAKVVRALQGGSVNLPIVVTAAATSPVFTAALADSSGSLAIELRSVGIDSGDLAALRSDDRGRARSAFLAAVRAAAGDETVLTYFDEQAFLTVAAEADTASHDAIVSLVSAAAKARSSEPGEIAAALKGLSLGWADGLAGAPLDFSTQQASSADAVTVLTSTTQGAGLRPGRDPGLNWFDADR